MDLYSEPKKGKEKKKASTTTRWLWNHPQEDLAKFLLHVKEESRETFRIPPNTFWQHVEINSLNITTFFVFIMWLLLLGLLVPIFSPQKMSFASLAPPLFLRLQDVWPQEEEEGKKTHWVLLLKYSTLILLLPKPFIPNQVSVHTLTGKSLK